MPQRHERFHAAFAERRNDLPVMRQFLFVELSFLRLDARPFEGKAVRGLAKRFCNIEILSEPVVMVARAAGNIIFFP